MSAAAREAERANAQIHRLRRERESAVAAISRLDDDTRAWLDSRRATLEAAPRGQVAAGAAQPASAAGAFASPPAPDARAWRRASPPPPTSPAYATGAPGPAAAPSSAAPRRAPRVSAAALLGLSGASLVLVAAIVFVAASWSTYPPPVRAGVLLAFAVGFAQLARVATRRRFPTMGGALAVLAAGFVGVAALALLASGDGVAPFAASAAFGCAAAAGLGLSRLGLRAVSQTAAGLWVLAVAAAVLEVTLRARGIDAALGVFTVALAAGGLVLAESAKAWEGSPRRAVAWSGVALVDTAALTGLVVAARLQASPGWAALALPAAFAAVARVAAWRPTVGAGALVAFGSLGATLGVAGAGADVAWTAVAAACTVAAGAAAVSRASGVWRRQAVVALAPAALFAGAVGALMGVGGALALVLGDGASRASAQLSGLDWSDVAVAAATLSVGAGAALVAARWRDPVAVTARARWTAVGLGLASLVAASTALGAAVRADGSAACSGLLAGAVVMWVAVRARGGTVAAVVRAVAVGTGVMAVVAAALRLAPLRAHLEPAGAVVLTVTAWVGVALLLVASARIAGAAGAASVLTLAVATVNAWRAGAPGAVTFVLVVVLAIAIVAASLAAPVAVRQPLAVGALPGLVAGALAGAGAAFAAAVAPFDVTFYEAPPWWSIAAAGLLAATAPVLARAMPPAARVAAVAATTSTGLVALASVSAFAALTRLEPHAQGLAPAALLLALGGALAVTALAPWRPAAAPLRVATSALVSIHAAVGVGLVATGGAAWPRALALVAVGAAGLALARRWPLLAAAPAVGLLAAIAPSALVPHDAWMAGAIAAVEAAVASWWLSAIVARSAPPARLRVFTAPRVVWGAAPVVATAAIALACAVASAGSAWAGAASGGVALRAWPLAVVMAAAAGALAWRPVRDRLATVLLVASALAAGLVAWPAGWVALAVAAPLAAEASARWRGRAGLWPGYGLAVAAVAIGWAVFEHGSLAVSLLVGAATLAWTAARAPHGALRRASAAAAPHALAAGLVLGLTWGGAEWRWAVLIAGVCGLSAVVALASARVSVVGDALWGLAVPGVATPLLLAEPTLSGLAVLLAGCAYLAADALAGVPHGRRIALWSLTPAAALLLAGAGVATVEAYTAVPAVTTLAVGLAWMRRDREVRSWTALSWGLGLALVPSYVAMVFDPELLARPLALGVGAVGLALIGVRLRWFAPLVGTASTSVVIALSQAVVEHALVPRWVSFAFLGAILLGLGFAAEPMRRLR